GTLTVTGNRKVNSTLTVTGDITSAADARIKTDIETLEGALEKGRQLRGVSYRHKKTGKDSTGFIAQEMREVLPCLVHAG
ncbi:tail fiber domain-containing protein, partial [Cobetia sp. SIMBA_158]|uniref:tail fiber domain-containing protein n=1 Tax=Cobetia sp. SIMBA_158 TaxID=3081617 RepID=UPI00398123D6